MAGQSKSLGAAVGAAGLALAVVPYAIKAVRLSGSERPERKKDADFSGFEFGGPIGAYATMLSLPCVIYFLYYGCGRTFAVPGCDLRSLAKMPLPLLSELFSVRAVGICAGWFGFQALLERTLPGKEVEGVDLAPAGGQGRLTYRMNGHAAFWVSFGFAAALRERLAVLYDEYAALAGASITLSVGFSAYLYWRSFRPGVLLAKGGDSGNAVYDFFIGRELNPRVFGSFDLKAFCELRPGLIGWTMLNLGMLAKQYQNTGAVGGSMLLVNLFQGLYVWDALYQEQAILSTMDITTDGFGYMLCFGDLAWVPFTYSLQARYLVDHDPQLPWWTLAAIAGMGLGGYVVFRASNSEKDRFRRDPADPAVKHLEVLEVRNRQTNRPSKLLVSGWWGLARKINYTGDWFMALAWSGATGWPLSPGGSILAYFYPIYFAGLLIHRASRDDHFCSEKYGDDWREYKRRVPYVFVPYLI